MCPTAPGAIGHRSLCMSISGFSGEHPPRLFCQLRRLRALAAAVKTSKVAALRVPCPPLAGKRLPRALVLRQSAHRVRLRKAPCGRWQSAPYMIVGALCPARSCRAIRQAGRVQIGAVAQNSGGGKGRDERLRRPCLCLVPCPARSE